jgi:hypothetical protein
MAMQKCDFYTIEGISNESAMQQTTGKNKAGRPIMQPTGVIVQKGDQFVVSGKHTESKAERVDPRSTIVIDMSIKPGRHGL